MVAMTREAVLTQVEVAGGTEVKTSAGEVTGLVVPLRLTFNGDYPAHQHENRDVWPLLSAASKQKVADVFTEVNSIIAAEYPTS